jgi:hypothetical protein
MTIYRLVSGPVAQWIRQRSSKASIRGSNPCGTADSKTSFLNIEMGNSLHVVKNNGLYTLRYKTGRAVFVYKNLSKNQVNKMIIPSGVYIFYSSGLPKPIFGHAGRELSRDQKMHNRLIATHDKCGEHRCNYCQEKRY